jgi:hypothetical protein
MGIVRGSETMQAEGKNMSAPCEGSVRQPKAGMLKPCKSLPREAGAEDGVAGAGARFGTVQHAGVAQFAVSKWQHLQTIGAILAKPFAPGNAACTRQAMLHSATTSRPKLFLAVRITPKIQPISGAFRKPAFGE